MEDLDVRTVTLEPMLVASAYGFGAEPEAQAWEKIMRYAEEQGLLQEPHRFFGFNNPSPSVGSPNYGYEQWVTVGRDAQPTGDVRIHYFAGGLYAVTRFQGLERIGRVWEQLVLWGEESPYRKGHHQWLEELLVHPSLPVDEWVFDLYLPIAE